MNKTAIFAGNFHQAKNFAAREELANSEWFYVDDVRRLYGMQLDSIFFVGTYYMNKLCKEVTEYCRSREMTIYLKG